LASRGFKILARNWRTKICEIDIIVETNEYRYFIEVKYRSTERYGGGGAAITPVKLRRMRFAAELYSVKYPTLKNEHLMAAIVDSRKHIRLLQVE